MRPPLPSLLVISDRTIAQRSLPLTARALAEAGCPWFMLREKDLGEEALAALFEEITAALEGLPMALSVNGSPALAARPEAAGVHLPQGHSVAAARDFLGPEKLVGQSAHNVREVYRAAAAGADYVTLSPVFESISKGAFAPALGLAVLAEVCAESNIPVIALGGVQAANYRSCLEAGAAGVAVLGAVMGNPDPGAACARFLAIGER